MKLHTRTHLADTWASLVMSHARKGFSTHCWPLWRSSTVLRLWH